MNVAAVVPTASAAEAGSKMAGTEENSKFQETNQQHLCYCPSIVTTMFIIRYDRHLNRYANKNYGKI
jgi:hypothetical protein